MSVELLPAAAVSVGWAASAVVQGRQLRRARRDPLTGLWTRAAFERRARRALRRRVLLVLVDLDEFKQVNDSFGHAAGDEVLAETARRLQDWAERGTAGRLGGDELVAVRPVGEHEDVAGLVEDLFRRLRLPVAGGRGQVSSSVGAVLAAAGMGLEAVLGDADAAMYAAKRDRGRVGWCVGEPLMVAPSPRRHKRTGLAEGVTV